MAPVLITENIAHVGISATHAWFAST